MTKMLKIPTTITNIEKIIDFIVSKKKTSKSYIIVKKVIKKLESKKAMIMKFDEYYKFILN